MMDRKRRERLSRRRLGLRSRRHSSPPGRIENGISSRKVWDATSLPKERPPEIGSTNELDETCRIVLLTRRFSRMSIRGTSPRKSFATGRLFLLVPALLLLLALTP